MKTTKEDPVLALVRDLSGGDQAVMAKVRQFFDTPPTTIEEIGFYGAEDEEPETRIYLAAVSALADADHLYSVEDKYSPEVFDRWVNNGVLGLDALPPEARAVFSSIMSFEYLDATEQELASFQTVLMRDYGQATSAFEQDLARRGKVLLSIDATVGDTLFFAVVESSVATKWCNTGFAEFDGYRSGVRPAMWDRFWDHLIYAMDLDDGVGDGAYPPGTRLRHDAIPMVVR